MYSLKIGLGGTGSNAAEPVTAHSAVSSGVHHPSAAAIIAAVPPTTTAPSLLSPSHSSAISPSASSLFLRLASPSTSSPFSPSLDAALSHVIPVSISARPVPLTIAESAAEVRRQERKQKKAERRKVEKGNNQPSEHSETEHTDSAATAGEHSHTNGHNGSSDAAAVDDTFPQPQPAVKGSRARKQRKAGGTKRALHDDDRLTLTVSQLKTIVATANEKVVRECCKQMTHLSVRQRKETQDSLTKEHAASQSSSLYQTLYGSSVVQAALRRSEESEQTAVKEMEVVETVSENAEGGIAGEAEEVAA